MILGLISDTHGLLRPQALEALQGCGLIVHAGDVGDAGIIERLSAIAPVIAVRGNIDKGDALPLTAAVELPPAKIYVRHIIQDLDMDPAAAGFNLVVTGHSHKAGQTQRGSVLYVNPGSAGPRRFRLPITVARLELERRPWAVEFIELA